MGKGTRRDVWVGDKERCVGRGTGEGVQVYVRREVQGDV